MKRHAPEPLSDAVRDTRQMQAAREPAYASPETPEQPQLAGHETGADGPKPRRKSRKSVFGSIFGAEVESNASEGSGSQQHEVASKKSDDKSSHENFLKRTAHHTQYYMMRATYVLPVIFVIAVGVAVTVQTQNSWNVTTEHLVNGQRASAMAHIENSLLNFVRNVVFMSKTEVGSYRVGTIFPDVKHSVDHVYALMQTFNHTGGFHIVDLRNNYSVAVAVSHQGVPSTMEGTPREKTIKVRTVSNFDDVVNETKIQLVVNSADPVHIASLSLQHAGDMYWTQFYRRIDHDMVISLVSKLGEEYLIASDITHSTFQHVLANRARTPNGYLVLFERSADGFLVSSSKQGVEIAEPPEEFELPAQKYVSRRSMITCEDVVTEQIGHTLLHLYGSFAHFPNASFTTVRVDGTNYLVDLAHFVDPSPRQMWTWQLVYIVPESDYLDSSNKRKKKKYIIDVVVTTICVVLCAVLGYFTYNPVRSLRVLLEEKGTKLSEQYAELNTVVEEEG